jgi:hypothetical protein
MFIGILKHVQFPEDSKNVKGRGREWRLKSGVCTSLKRGFDWTENKSPISCQACQEPCPIQKYYFFSDRFTALVVSF